MSDLLVSQLRHTLSHLRTQSSSAYTVLEKQRLQQMLNTTIDALRTLYPDHLNHSQRFQLLQNLTMLEQQSFTIGPVEDAVLVTNLLIWQALHESLITTIETTLTDESHTLR
jgi:hypothetical protein